MTFEVKKTPVKKKAPTNKEVMQELEQQLADQAMQMAEMYKLLEPQIQKGKDAEERARLKRESDKAEAYAKHCHNARELALRHVNENGVYATAQEKIDNCSRYILEHYKDVDASSVGVGYYDIWDEVKRGIDAIKHSDRTPAGYGGHDSRGSTAKPDAVSYYIDQVTTAAQMAKGVSHIMLQMAGELEDKAESLKPKLEFAISRQAEDEVEKEAKRLNPQALEEQQRLQERLRTRRVANDPTLTEHKKQQMLQEMIG